ncbi:ABC transporter permease [Emticicia sp. BO119]|uniref:ABC transporter permease n=1 Tax=Emticicia sp. BO119 TaxID=2757768 RepID=UPI0015F02644|nr:ABC transporter permease [Emticicia sp. BO119]MBA4850876.1 ABC transporter permease [Emticicia sp. BO119]
MLRNYLKITLRSLFKNKTFTLINVSGLAISLACCIVLGLYAYSEISFDRFHQKNKQIFRINKVVSEVNKTPEKHSITSGALATVLPREIPEIEYAVRFRPWFNEMGVNYGTTQNKLSDVAYADADFFQIFDFKLLKGDRQTVLSEPNTAVITEKTSKRFFGNNDPIGKTLITLNETPVTITGVTEDVPLDSHIKFDMLISWKTTTSGPNKDYFPWLNNWLTQVVYTYVLVKENADNHLVESKIATLFNKNLPERKDQYKHYLQSINDIYLGSADVKFSESFRSNSDKIVYALIGISIFILLIACFNFINLSTVLSLKRVKEVGMQKVLGAVRKQLIFKSFIESSLVCLTAFLLALLLVSGLLPDFNQLANAHIDFSQLLRPGILFALVGFIIIVSLMAGLYPALFQTRFQAVDVFKSTTKVGKDSWLRQSLVITQFTLSTLLIIGMIVINNQIDFLVKKDLGFDKDQQIIIQLTDTGMESKAKLFVSNIQSFDGVEKLSLSARVPGQGYMGFGIIPEGYTEKDNLMAGVQQSDANYTATYNIPMVKGRFFSKDFPTDTLNSIVINEAMVKYLNWQNPIGKRFKISGGIDARVIGVMKDYNVVSLRETIQPAAFILKDNPLYLTLKIKTGKIKETLAFVGKTWKELESKHPFNYYFLDERLNQYYASDVRLLQVISIFAGLAILVACLGLFGLASFAAETRTKEIGIRKVLGASILSVTTLLSKDFLKLVFLSIIIASPIAYYGMKQWLQDFAYRIDIEWWVFVLAGVSATAIALLTVSYQAIKAALMNPIKSLKTE